jgi:hypothetical protein
MDNGKPYSEGEFDIKEVANGMRYIYYNQFKSRLLNEFFYKKK